MQSQDKEWAVATVELDAQFIYVRFAIFLSCKDREKVGPKNYESASTRLKASKNGKLR